MEHVRLLVRSLRLLPRSPQIVESATGREPLDAHDVADWLWDVHRSFVTATQSSPDDWTLSEATVHQRVIGSVTAAASTLRAELERMCEELDEAAVRQAVVARHGPVTDDHRHRMQGHLANLERLVRAAAGHGPETWTTPERDSLAYDPVATVAAMRCESLWTTTPDEYKENVKAQLERILGPRPCAHLDAVSGDSQLRPQAVYAAMDL